MKKRLIYILPFLFVLVVCSCHRNDQDNTPFGRVQGKWRLAKVGSDDNRDGTVENYEIKAVSRVQIRERIYSGNGTGVESNTYDGNKQADLVYNWSIINNDSLHMQYKANDTITYYMMDVTSGDMTLTQNTQLGITLEYWVKE